jgi:hypothetical protein
MCKPARACSVKNTENAQPFEFEFKILKFPRGFFFSDFLFSEFPEFREIGPNFFEIYIVHTVKMAHNIAF